VRWRLHVAGGLEAAGFAQDKITCIDVFSEGAAERTAAALAAAKAANEKLVLHCAGGEGRTAVVLAQWLVGEGLGDTAAVCKDLVAFAATKDAARKAVSLHSVSHPIVPRRPLEPHGCSSSLETGSRSKINEAGCRIRRKWTSTSRREPSSRGETPQVEERRQEAL